jgi:hypothetical protein
MIVILCAQWGGKLLDIVIFMLVKFLIVKLMLFWIIEEDIAFFYNF